MGKGQLGNNRIEGAYKRWKNYRNAITDYICNLYPDSDDPNSPNKHPRLLILGAGACDDIHIEGLCDAGFRLYLCDVNQDALDQVTYSSDQITKLPMDFLGISSEDYQSFEKACLEGELKTREWWETHKTNEFRLNLLETFMRKQGIEQFDLMITLGLHSQLFVDFIRIVKENANMIAEEVKRYILEQIQNMQLCISEDYLEKSKHLAKKILLGYEYTTFFAEEKSLQQEIIEGLQKKGPRIFEQYSLPRVEGAYQLEQALGEMYEAGQIEVLEQNYLIWPFIEEKSYLMVLYLLNCDTMINDFK